MTASETLPPLPPMRSFADRKLRISLEVPRDWTVRRDDGFPLSFYAPPEPEYKSHLSLKDTRLEPPTLERFQELIDETYHGNLRDVLDSYELVEDGQFRLDDRNAYFARFEWRSEQLGLHFSQLDTLVLVDVDTFFEIHGFTIKPRETTYLPIFLHMVDSMRFLPAPPST